MEKQKKLFLFVLILHWVFLWGSINTLPHELGFTYMITRINFFENFLESLWMMRTILPLISSTIILFLLFSIKKINKFNKFHLLFFLIFTFQIVGLYLNKDRFFCDIELIRLKLLETNDIEIFKNEMIFINGCYLRHLFLPLQGIGTIILFILCDYKKIENILKYFFWITIALLILILVTTIIPKIPDLVHINFGETFQKKDKNLFNLANPRTTGISRTLAIINLFLILIFFNIKKFYFKNLLIIPILIFSILLIYIQSRGTLLCYLISLLIFIFFLNKTNFEYKIKSLLILIVLPVLLYSSAVGITNEFNNKDENINNRIFEAHSSGRKELWTYAIKKNNYNKIFGYGTQGDRFFLKNFEKSKTYGNNSSNIFIYTLLSGGVISVIILLLFYYAVFNLFFRNRKKIFFKDNSLYLNFSIVCIIFLLIRSNFENSFGLFSLDFLIMYLSLMYVINSTKIIKAK